MKPLSLHLSQSFIYLLLLLLFLTDPEASNAGKCQPRIEKTQALGTMNESHQLVCTQFHEGTVPRRKFIPKTPVLEGTGLRENC